MRIRRVHVVEAVGAFYNDDQEAIRRGAELDGMFYQGTPNTPGFARIRTPATAVSIGLVLDNGYLAWGDAVSVQYGGVGGRERYRSSSELKRLIEQQYVDHLIGVDVSSARHSHVSLFGVGGPLEKAPMSVRYGVSQALLRCAASRTQEMCFQTICREYNLPLPTEAIPIFGQSGDVRFDNVDRMILRRLDVLPHGLLNTADLVGTEGCRLLDYVSWIVGRIQKFAPDNYRPTLHLDTYGCIGSVFSQDLDEITRYLTRLREAAQPYRLQVEAVADFGSRTAQVEQFAELRARLAKASCDVRLVVDEWCNTVDDVEVFLADGAADLIQLKLPDIGSLLDAVEAMQLCNQAGVGAYVGGSCAETDLSARLSVHVALAGQAAMMLAKPGMGVDEGHMIVANEQSRCLALVGGAVDPPTDLRVRNAQKRSA